FQPDTGEILLEGKRVIFSSASEARKAGIQVVHQEPILVPYLSVAENLFLGLERAFWFSHKKLIKLAGQAFERLGFDLNVSLPAWQLSVRERKLVQITQAFLTPAKILIFDEPTAVLFPDDVERMAALIKQQKEHGVGIVYISHRLEEVFQLADNVTILKDGRVVGHHSIQEVDIHGLIKKMIGRELGDLFPPRRDFAPSQKILEVSDLKTQRLLRGIKFVLHKGEILGIGGLKGHGQDVLLRALFGVIPLTEGNILINGRKVRINSPRDALKHGMVLVTERRSEEGLCPVLSFRLNTALPNLRACSKCGLVNYGLENEHLREIVSQLRIQLSSFEQPVWQLSGGTKQKVIMGKWIVKKPCIWLLIEPTMGIDVGTKREIYFALRKLADEGSGIILVTSDMKELVGLCDRVLVMREGRITGEFRGPEITEENIVKAALEVTESASTCR
ncbi:MAG: sugar ABC transporter ATP-binding protein, partial [Candidatus Methanomethyliaceae archaeon]